ncbi:hypothetical protein RZR10_23300, partial [Enterobacter asburiae]|nr:hypothetical protein [Enterobacter asburiae]
GTVCVVGKMRDLILQLSKSSIYSTKPNTVSSPATFPQYPRSFPAIEIHESLVHQYFASNFPFSRFIFTEWV